MKIDIVFRRGNELLFVHECEISKEGDLDVATKNALNGFFQEYPNESLFDGVLISYDKTQ